MKTQAKLPDVVWFQEGPGVRKYQYRETGIKLLNVANLVDGKVDLSTSSRFISPEEAYGKYKHFLVDDGDLIIASSGIQVSYFDKKMGFANKSHLPLCMNTSTIRFKAKDSSVLDIHYFMYFLKSYSFKGQLAKQITGSAQLNFGPSHLQRMSISFPTIAEQEKIVAELDCLTGIIEKKKRQLEELDKLAQSIFYEMFGDPITNEKGWPYKSFGQLYDVKSSKRLYQSELSDGGVPFYKIADIVDLINGVKVVPVSFVPTEKFSNLKQSGLVPQEGDILLTSRGTLGMCYIISADDEFYFQDGMITWFSNGAKDMTPIFVKYLFKNDEYNLYLLKHGNFTTVAYISINQLKGMLCPIPPRGLQSEFAKKVEAIEKQKELVKRSIVETETLFNSRMDYWFN